MHDSAYVQFMEENKPSALKAASLNSSILLKTLVSKKYVLNLAKVHVATDSCPHSVLASGSANNTHWLRSNENNSKFEIVF